MSWKIVSFFVFGAFVLFFIFKIRLGKNPTDAGCVTFLIVVWILALICTAIVFALGNLLDWWAELLPAESLQTPFQSHFKRFWQRLF